MLTTTQVRAIIRKHKTVSIWDPIWTNKTRKNPGNQRSVKCYFLDNYDLLDALIVAAGKENVKVTPGAQYSSALGPAITVKCNLG